MSSREGPSRFVAEHVRGIPYSGIRDFFDIVQGVPDVISLGIGEPDFVTPWRIREAAIYSLESGHTSYTANMGLLRLREEISGYVAQNYHVQYDPQKEILVTVGVSQALDLALRATINPGDQFLYHEPCYVSYVPSIDLVHGCPRQIHCTEESRFAVTPQALEEALTDKTKAIVLNFPTNPTGGTMSREELEAIAKIVRERDILVISDEVYSELTFEGEHTSIASLPGMKERTLFLHGFSKAFAMTGFRIGYACGPAELIEAMMKIHQYSMLCAGTASQEAAIEALRHGRDECIAMRDEYKLRRNYIVEALNSIGLSCHMPRGSFYAFPSIASTGLSSKEFAGRLVKEKKVACIPGNAFGPSGEGFLRCCFATSLDKIEIAMERMAAFVSEVRDGGSK
ncbi:MAG: aminotransferase class I/II-fold pyridoxal phosphate-dependent enzyme [Limisphaerales bacterium]|jgi:aminotransferase|nr:aminotransferase class I/II-fold pyridoxal phosphate-dependent enzyme [Verrucomicrobiota bacterium]